MTCFLLNEGVYSKIRSTLENPNAAECPADQTYYKSIYSPATLINDWYEKRIEKVTQNATSEPPLSENMDQYRDYCTHSVPDREAYFNQIFDSYGLGKELLMDHSGFAYYNNYTTTYDLMYNHLTKGICGPKPRHYFKGSYRPETDLTAIFGNLTQWGLKEQVYESIKHSKTPCTAIKDLSEVQDEYKEHNMQTVRKLNDFPNFKRVKVVY